MDNVHLSTFKAKELLNTLHLLFKRQCIVSETGKRKFALNGYLKVEQDISLFSYLSSDWIIKSEISVWENDILLGIYGY